MTLRVIVPHTEDGIRPEVRAELERQGAQLVPLLTPRRDRFSYAEGLRRAWDGTSDLVVCEADVEPAPGALEVLWGCSHLWCVHRLWIGTHYDTGTLGLVRWSARLMRDVPDLMHQVAAPMDPRYWVRRGWTAIDPDCSVATLNSAGKRAPLLRTAPSAAAAPWVALRPTTRDSLGMDAAIVSTLLGYGVEPHLHEPPPNHLHDYEAPHQERQRPWWDVPRDAVDWPTD
jgi:hypothetical protein